MTGPARVNGAPAGQAHLPPANATSEEGRAAESLGEKVRALFGRSLHIRTVDTGSCAVCESEIRLLLAPHYDLHRLGLFFTPAPRHADLLMVTGPAVRAMDNALAKTYSAMPEPKIVVAVGACPLGGVYPEDDLAHGRLDNVLPVDVYIPGCPPSPLALLQGLLVAVGRLSEKVSGLSFAEGGAVPPAQAGPAARGRLAGVQEPRPPARRGLQRPDWEGN